MEMEEACIVSNCLTMQASSFARRHPGRLFWNSRPGVRAKKPNLLALREVRREPRRRPGRLF